MQKAILLRAYLKMNNYMSFGSQSAWIVELLTKEVAGQETLGTNYRMYKRMVSLRFPAKEFNEM